MEGEEEEFSITGGRRLKRQFLSLKELFSALASSSSSIEERFESLR